MIRLFLLLLILVLPLQCFSYGGAKVAEPSDTGVIQKVFKPNQWRKKLFVNGTDSIFICYGEYRKLEVGGDKHCRLVTDDLTGITKKAKELPLKEALMQEYRKEIGNLNMESSDNELVVTFNPGKKVEIKRDEEFFNGFTEASHVELLRRVLPVVTKFFLLFCIPVAIIVYVIEFLKRVRIDSPDSLQDIGRIDRIPDINNQREPLEIGSIKKGVSVIDNHKDSNTVSPIVSATPGKRKVILD